MLRQHFQLLSHLLTQIDLGAKSTIDQFLQSHLHDRAQFIALYCSTSLTRFGVDSYITFDNSNEVCLGIPNLSSFHLHGIGILV